MSPPAPLSHAADSMTLEEAAALLGLSRPGLRRLIAQGALQGGAAAGDDRLLREAVIACRDRIAAERREALRHLLRLSEEVDP
jgi:excisionase family DNA binding protein